MHIASEWLNQRTIVVFWDGIQNKKEVESKGKSKEEVDQCGNERELSKSKKDRLDQKVSFVCVMKRGEFIPKGDYDLKRNINLFCMVR